jgi:hypothetical protein
MFMWFHEEMLADAVLADVDAGRVIGDRVVRVELGEIGPHPLVEVIAVGPLQAFDRAHVLGCRDVDLERVEPCVERVLPALRLDAGRGPRATQHERNLLQSRHRDFPSDVSQSARIRGQTAISRGRPR